MRQFCSCQMCHNQWIPAYSHQNPVQPLGDVCCAGAKETAHRPVVFLSLLLHLAGQKICVCLHTFALLAITRCHTPLESCSEGAIRDCFCLSDAGAGSRAAGQEPHFSTSCLLHQHRQCLALCLQVSMQQAECVAFSLDQGPRLDPFLGKWPQSFEACSSAPFHSWLMTSTQPQQPDTSVGMGHPPSWCSETANMVFAP